MVGEWQSAEFAQICEHSAFGPRFAGELYTTDGNVATLRTTDISADGRIEYDTMPLASLDLGRFQQHLLRVDDLVITRSGRIGTTALFNGFHLPVLPGAFLIRFRLKRDIAEPRFYRYFFNSPVGQELLTSVATGSVQQNINITSVHGLPVPVPPLSEQRAIAHILGTLDDKIELNRRMNETLEEIARAIFKSWFVDFEPVRAKAEGRDPGLPKHIADLFPDRFEDSELGEIPAGWSVMPIGEAVRVVGGGTPSTKEPAFWEDGNHCWATPKDLSKLQDPILLDTERKVTDAGLAKISSGLLPAGTVLLSSRAPVGYLAVARVPVSVNQGFIAMVCEGPLTNHYALHWAFSNMEKIEGRASGTTFQEISKKNFRPILVLVPSDPTLAAFEERVSALYDKITVNLQQTRALIDIRDAFLPRLISGEVRVPDAKQVIEGIE